MSESYEQTFTLREALEFGVQLHREGRLTEAEAVYRQILAAAPQQPDACHFLGMLMCQLGRREEGLDWMKQAVAVAPDHADAHNSLGNLHKAYGRLDEAEQAYRKVIELKPGFAAAYNNLGIVLKERGELQEAVNCFLKAVEFEPEFADAHYNRGNALARQGQEREAVAAYEFAIALEPKHLEAHQQLAELRARAGKPEEAERIKGEAQWLRFERSRELYEQATAARKQGLVNEAVAFLREAIAYNHDFKPAYNSLGFILNVTGRGEDAIAVWRQWLEREPGNPVAMHMLASATGERVPARASDEFVKATFEGFAATFDEKLKSLDYRAPELVLRAVSGQAGDPAGKLDVLDAGCGTGWCGPGLRGFSRRLTGVDLSQSMLDKARVRSVYDELVEAELTTYLRGTAAAYDLIVSSDTLVYFGDLTDVMEAAFDALRPGGALVFTLEKAAAGQGESGYLLHDRGRYSHTSEYAKRALAQAGFRLRGLVEETLRMESGRPVEGLVVVATRP